MGHGCSGGTLGADGMSEGIERVSVCWHQWAVWTYPSHFVVFIET